MPMATNNVQGLGALPPMSAATITDSAGPQQRRAIAKAITLLESTRADHRAQAAELLTAVLAWRAQGRKSKWTTAASRHLVEVVDRLRERYPELCETLTAEPDEERPPCPECHQPMARFAGPGSERGWTCVRCEASDG